MRAHVRWAVALVIIMMSVGFVPASARADAPAASPDTTAPVAAKVSVTVMGRVKNPGRYVLDPGARLSDALTTAGAYELVALVARSDGPPVPNTECTPGGSELRYIYLVRAPETPTPRQTSYAIEAARMRDHKDLRYDPLLREGDKVFVPDCRPAAKVILTPPTFPTSSPY